MNTKLALFFFIAFLCAFTYLMPGCPTLQYHEPFDPMAQQDRMDRQRDANQRAIEGF